MPSFLANPFLEILGFAAISLIILRSSSVSATWWALSFEGERFDRFKKMVNSYKIGYLLCSGNAKADEIIFDYYRSFNPKAYIKYGVNCAKACELFVCGNYIAQVFYEEIFRQKLDKVYNILDNTNQKAMRKLMETLFFAKVKITLVVIRNEDLAEQIKEETLDTLHRKL